MEKTLEDRIKAMELKISELQEEVEKNNQFFLEWTTDKGNFKNDK